MRTRHVFHLILLAGSGACARTEQAMSAPVQVVALDYAFQVPAQLPSGRTVFQLVNKGKVRHEFNIALLKKGVSMDRLLQTRRADVSGDSLLDGSVGVLFASPGESNAAKLAVDLIPGREYAVICIFRDSANAPPHYDKGMYSVIRVESAPTKAVGRRVPVDTIVSSEYFFKYPGTVPPGTRSFVLRNEGKVTHELSITLLKKGVTFENAVEVEKAGGDVDALVEKDHGLLFAKTGKTPLGQLEIDMQPGREYVIVCYLQDSDKSKPHYELGMFGSIRVTGEPAA